MGSLALEMLKTMGLGYSYRWLVNRFNKTSFNLYYSSFFSRSKLTLPAWSSRQVLTLVDKKDRTSQKIQKVSSWIRRGKRRLSPIGNNYMPSSSLHKDSKWIGLQASQSLSKQIQEHASLRMQQMYYLFLIYYQTSCTISRSKTIFQHGWAKTVDCEAAHSALLPTLIDNFGETILEKISHRQDVDFIKSLLLAKGIISNTDSLFRLSDEQKTSIRSLRLCSEKSYILHMLNITSELPFEVNRVDSLLEKVLRVSALDILNACSRSLITPYEALHNLCTKTQKTIDTYLDEQINPLKIQIKQLMEAEVSLKNLFDQIEDEQMKDPVFVRDLILKANNFYFLFFKVKSLFKALGLTFRKTPFQFEYTEYLSQVNKYGQNYLATLKKCHSLADVKNLARGLKKKNIGDRLFSEGQSKLNDILDQSSFKLSKRLMQDFLEKYKPGVLEQLVKMHNREKFVEALLVAKRKPVNSRVKMLSLSRQLIFMHRVEAVIKHQKIGSRPLPLSLLSGCQKGGVRRAFSKVELTRQQRQLLLREVKF